MSNQRSKPEILAELAEDFVVRFRRGERPSVNEYVQQHPDLSEDIQKVIKTLLTIEQRASNSASAAAAPDGNNHGDLPRQIGDFRIIRQVGRGGMGIVYEAEQMSLGRRVALKVLPQQMLLDERQRKRFEREARAVAKLHHTNIVPVFGVGESDGLHYYVMQFIQGLGLNEVLKEVQQNCQQRPGEGSATLAPLRVSRRDLVSSDTSHPSVSIRDPQGGQGTRSGVFFDLPRQEDVTIDGVSGEVAQSGSHSSSSAPAGALSDTFTLSDPSGTWPDVSDGDSIPRNQPADYWHSVANIGYQVASALHYAHEQGVFHRDVKPSNLLLDTHGTVWVLDFGLAKASDQHDLTHSGDLLGTLRYMSPEALDGKTDARSDIYSLGLTLYELLALQPAFNETVSNKLIKQVSDHEPTRLDKFGAKIPRDLVTVVHKAIDRDPNRRYQSSRELAEDLNHFLNDEPIRARRTSTVEHVWRWSRRNRGLAAAVAMIAILLLTINIAGPILTIRLKNAYDAEVTARSHARQAQNEALDSLDLAEQREQDLNHTLYRAEMNLAGQAAAERAGIERIWDLTEAWRPDEKGVDLRDWEWFYLHGLGRLAQQTIRVDGGNAEAIAWSPDGSLLVFGQDDGTLVVWNPRTEKTILRKNLHKAHVLHVCWSPDGTKVASIASQDKLVRVWDPLTGNELQSFPLPGENDWSSSVSFSRDSRLLAADSRNEITIWDLQLDRQLRTLTMPEVSQVAWSPVDNRIAALSKHHRIIIWDGSTGEQLAKYEHGSGCFAWDPHGEHLAYAGQDRRMHILDLSNGKTVHSPVGHVAEIATLAWNTDGTRLASAGKDTTVRIWDPKTGDEVARLRGHAGFVTSLAWMPDRPLLATSARDRTLKIWNTDSTEERLLLKGHRAPIKSLSWGPDGRYLAMSSGTWTAVWDVDGRSEIREQLGQRSALSPDGERLAVASGAKIEIHDTRSGDLISILSGHTEGITRLAWDSEGTRLASASWDGTACIWNPATEEQLTTIELSHRDRGICWSPVGLRLATIGNRDVQIWDAESGTQQLQYSRPGPNSRHRLESRWKACCVGRLGPRDFHLGCQHGQTRVDVGGPHQPHHLAVLESQRHSPRFGKRRPNRSRLGCSVQGRATFTRAHPVGVTNVTWSPDGLRIASGDQNGQVVIWDASTGHLVERTPQAITILDRRIETNPTAEDLALRRNTSEHGTNRGGVEGPSTSAADSRGTTGRDLGRSTCGRRFGKRIVGRDSDAESGEMVNAGPTADEGQRRGHAGVAA